MKKFYFLVSISVLILDYFTKLVVVNNLNFHSTIKILPFLDIVYVKNTGIAFGMFRGIGNNIFIAISIIAIVVLFILILKDTRNGFALSLLLGGACGNLLDRITRGYVVDFIDVYAGKYHWPVFNIADSSLTIGVILLIIGQLRHKEKVAK